MTRDPLTASVKFVSQNSVREIVQSEDARRLFVLAHAALSETLSDDAYSLGGGTALAARWQHRDSTEIDLVMSPETCFRLIDDPPGFKIDSNHSRAVRAR